MAITEKKTTTVTVADAVAEGSRVKVTVGRGLTVDESKALRKLLKKAEASVQCDRKHTDTGYGLWPQRLGYYRL